MKQLAILVGLLIVAAGARAQSKNIHENVDPYSGLRMLFLEVSTRTCPGDSSPGLHDPQVHLLFTAMQNADKSVSYQMSPELDGAGYTLDLHNSGSMETLIDGVAGGFTTHSGSTTTHRYAGDHSYLHETIPFDVTPYDLARLSTSERFQFRIDGAKYEVQRCTDAKRMRDLGEFMDAAAGYGPPQGSVPMSAAPGVPKPFVEKVNASTHLKSLNFASIPTEPCPGDSAPGPEVRVAVSADQHSEGGVWYFVSTEVYGGAHLGLDRGGTIEILMDGKTDVFHTINGSVRSYGLDGAGRSVAVEKTAFHVHQKNLTRLSEASAVEFRVGGPENLVRRCVRAGQLKDLDGFIGLAARYEASPVAVALPPR